GEKPAGFVTHFAFRVADTAACLAAAVAAGAVVTVDLKTLTIPSKPKEIPVCLAFCKGPDGEIIEFFQEL
ncbi:MAG TPA: VOC family protein, partial [Lentisphaeria bacterium]|nr:VOC family protein [Lentisphaeria bacterium]